MRKVTDLSQDLVEQLAQAAERPEYVRVAGGGLAPQGPQGPRLGIRPSYGDEKDGVLLSGVVEGGAAAKAGLKEGDRIVELAGKTVKNLEVYMALMTGHKKGESLEVGILRDGNKINVKIVLE